MSGLWTYVMFFVIAGVAFSYFQLLSCTSKSQSNVKADISRHDSCLIYFLLLLSLYLAWYPLFAERGLVFSFLCFSCLPWWASPAWSIVVLLLAVYIICIVMYARTGTKFPCWLCCLKKRSIRSYIAGGCIILVSLAFLSFLLVDYAEIAKKTVLPLPTAPLIESQVSSAEEPHEHTSPLPTAVFPRTRLLTTEGEFWSRIMFPIMGGILAAIALYFTYQRTSAIMAQTENGRQQIEAMIKQTENGQRQICAEQFKNAIDQLGSDKQAIILGGIHTLHHLACYKPEEYAPIVFDILCSFIREETGKSVYQENNPANRPHRPTSLIEILPSQEIATHESPSGTSEGANRNMEQPAQDEIQISISKIVIQTILKLLFSSSKGKEVYRHFEADLNHAWLVGCDLRNACLVKANLDYANLQDCLLEAANLNAAKLRHAILNDAKLEHAQLCNADLEYAYFARTDLMYAKFEYSRMCCTTWWHTDFSSANLHRAQLWNASFGGALFRGTDLRGTDLLGADFNDARLDQTKFDTNTDVTNAHMERIITRVYIDSENEPETSGLAGACIYENDAVREMTPLEKYQWFVNKGAHLGEYHDIASQDDSDEDDEISLADETPAAPETEGQEDQ